MHCNKIREKFRIFERKQNDRLAAAFPTSGQVFEAASHTSQPQKGAMQIRQRGSSVIQPDARTSPSRRSTISGASPT
jgi:hypothetical protein